MLKEHYEAARNDAAIVREDWLGVLKLTGSERQSWLQGMVSNDVEKLSPGQGCYAAHLNAQGKLVAHMVILCAEDALWMIVEAVAVAKLAATFDRLIIMEDAQVQDVSQEFDVLALMGAKGKAVLEAWAGKPFPGEGSYMHEMVGDCRVLRGVLGLGLIVPRAVSQQTLQGLAEPGATLVNEEVWEALRIEAGFPRYGVDVDETTTLPELGERAISYDKGCYIGQEVVAKIKYLGHVNRRFSGFICEGDDVPHGRHAVQRQGKEVGYTTSAMLSPALNRPIALGFVSRASAEPGTEVVLVSGEKAIPARVAALPFVENK